MVDLATGGSPRLRRALTTLALVAAAWAVTLLSTNGVSVRVGALRISSHNGLNPAIGALALIALALLCAPPGARADAVTRDVVDAFGAIGLIVQRWGRRLGLTWTAPAMPRVIAAAVAAVVLLTLGVSWTRGAYIAGGSDSYGYVSEAHLFATGRLQIDVPLARAFPHAPLTTLTPLAYRPAVDGGNALVPVYAPGLPLTMALFELVGGMNAVYAVMPLLAALAVWSTYRLGRQLAGPSAGLGASLLLFGSPVFLFQLMAAPMSDIPAAAWWALSTTLLLDAGGFWISTAAGVAAGLAILTRPNLLLVVVVLGSYLLWQTVSSRGDRRLAIVRLVAFSIPVVVACLTVAALNATWYGSPLSNGYGSGLFHLRFWSDNVRQFATWLTQTQTPLFFLGFLAPFVVKWLPPQDHPDARPAWLLVGVALAVYASYLFYMPFDVWWYLRFLLPAFPALAALTAATLAAAATRFGAPARLAAVLIVGGVVLFGYNSMKGLNGLGEYRYRIIAEWVRDHTPEQSIIVTMLHSGSMLHYSGRPIARYDQIPRGDYEAALMEMAAAGYHPYLVVDDWEVESVRRLHDDGPHGALDWPPLARLRLNNVQVFDLSEDIEAARKSGRKPQLIPVPRFVHDP